MTRVLLIAGLLALTAGCAAPEERPLPAHHPANADAPEVPAPAPSRTLDVKAADPIGRPAAPTATPTAMAHDHSAHDESTRDHAIHATPAAAPATEQAKAIYTCPMHPEVTSDQPGRCPRCGMTLERKGAGEKP